MTDDRIFDYAFGKIYSKTNVLLRNKHSLRLFIPLYVSLFTGQLVFLRARVPVVNIAIPESRQKIILST